MRRILAVSVLLAAGCGRGLDGTCEETLTCPGGDGGADTLNDGTVDAPPGCDPTKDPKDSPLCVANTFGVFVSPTGSDGQPGTREQPVASPTKGLELAKKQGLPRVYLCEGTYGAVSIAVAQDGLSLFGGFDCATWTPGTKPTSLVSADNKPALKLDGATTTLVDLALKNGNATVAGDSSIAAFATKGKLTLRRVTVEAGDGKAATQAVTPADFGARAADGQPGTAGNGGGKTDNACANGSGTSTGAVGGGPNGGGLGGGSGAPFATYPVNPAGATGAGGTPVECGGSLGGRPGSFGPGGPGGAGALKLGALDATGLKPGAGSDGTLGKVGQGGGGGASVDNSGGGGGGGSGGCGGVAGLGGAGGGASVALALVNTSATLQSVTLTAHNAGDGAQGGTGQKAQEGGFKGTFFANSCTGGAGGHGGSGGGGGGGSGGLSAGIAWTGTAPILDGTATPTAPTLPNVTLGTAGKAGAAGSGGAAFKTTAPASNPGLDGTAGVAGVAQAVLEVK